MTWPIDEETKRRLDQVDGLIPEEVGLYLAYQAALVPVSQQIINIGVYKGKSVAYLATGSRGALVVGVDPWNMVGNKGGRFDYDSDKTRRAAHDQLQAYDHELYLHRIRLWQEFSIDAAKAYSGRVGLLFVDGDHSYKSVKEDVLAWERHLVPGGTIVLDDWGTEKNPGVKEAADELAKRLGPYSIHAERLAVWNAG